MAVESRLATFGLFQVDTISGRVYQRGAGNNLSIKEVLRFQTEHRIVEDATLSNTSGNPNLKTYLELEAADGFQLKEVNQSFVVTEKIT